MVVLDGRHCSDLAHTLNSLGVTPRDVSPFTGYKQAGALCGTGNTVKADLMSVVRKAVVRIYMYLAGIQMSQVPEKPNWLMLIAEHEPETDENLLKPESFCSMQFCRAQ